MDDIDINDYIDPDDTDVDIPIDEETPYNGFDQAQDMLELTDWEMAEYKAFVYDTVEERIGDDADAEMKEACANAYAFATAYSQRQLIGDKTSWRRRLLNWL